MEIQPPEHPPAQARPVTSKLAIWSLVTGILSMLCSFLTGIPAVIMGIVSLNKIKKSNGALGGGGMAIAGIVTGVIGSFVVGVAALSALAAPVLIRQRQKADAIALTSNLKMFYIQALEYSEEHNDTFPDKAIAAGYLADFKISRASNGTWLYFPQASVSTPDEILLISPATPDTVVLRVDGSVKVLKKWEMDRQLIDTSRTPPVEIPATRR